MKQLSLIILISLCFSLLIACSDKKAEQSSVPIRNIPSEKLKKYIDVAVTDSTFLRVLMQQLETLAANKQWDNAADLLMAASEEMDRASVLDTAFNAFSEKYIATHQPSLDKLTKAKMYNGLGMQYLTHEKFDKSIDTYKAALLSPTDTEMLYNNAKVRYGLMCSYLYKTDLENALKVANEGLTDYEALKDSAGMAEILSGIGSVYRYMEDFDESLKYHDLSLKYLKNSKDTMRVFIEKINKIVLLIDIESPEIIPFVDKTKKEFNTWKNPSERAKRLMDAVYAFRLADDNQLVEAKILIDALQKSDIYKTDYATRELTDAAKIEYEVNLGKGITDIASHQANLKAAYLKKDYLYIQSYNDILYLDALQRKDYATALAYYEKAQEARDALNNESRQRIVKELDRKYKVAYKEQQLALKDKVLAQKNIQIILLLVGLGALLIAAISYYFWKRHKDLTKEKQRNSNFTKQLLQHTEDERKRIASDLHDSISHELLTLKSVMGTDLASVNTKIDSIINDVRSISRNLHPVMFDKIGLVANIETLVERLQLQNDFMISTDISYKGFLHSTDELQLYRIVQEALTNILKYANAHAAKITIHELPDMLFMEIRDNGKGFNVKQVLESTRAFGLHNIQARSQAIGGEALIQSSESGTVISVTIPKKS